MIINKKIFELLNGDLKNLTPAIRRKIEKDEKIRVYSILETFTFKELGYSFDDFLKDGYGDCIKEKKAMYLILSEYKSIQSFCEIHSIKKQNFYILLTKGIEKLPKSLIEKKEIFMKYFEMEYDISNFKVEYYKKHIELFGNPEQLKTFKEKHKIICPVRYEPIKESWHLAFDGPLAEYIKYKEKP